MKSNFYFGFVNLNFGHLFDTVLLYRKTSLITMYELKFNFILHTIPNTYLDDILIFTLRYQLHYKFLFLNRHARNVYNRAVEAKLFYTKTYNLYNKTVCHYQYVSMSVCYSMSPVCILTRHSNMMCMATMVSNTELQWRWLLYHYLN